MYKALVALVMFIVASPVYAEILTGTNTTLFLDISQGGGTGNSANNKVILNLELTVGNATSFTNNLCVGYICVFYGPSGELLSVAFMLDTNIGAGQQSFVDTSPVGIYSANQISKPLTCVENPSIADNPVFGIIYGGTKLKYIRMDNPSVLKVSQVQTGNLFVVPVTGGGCSSVRSKVPLSSPIMPFVPISDELNAIELALTYPFDLVGDFSKTGKFTLVLEKNETGIIGRPV